MTGSFQQQALVRKLVYIGVILALFVVTLCYRYFVLQRHAEALALREMSRGDVELGGSALRLVLTGSRGVVVCALSYEIMEAHDKNQWNKEELITRYLTKLLPHYIEPWLYHSWNLAYNVSVEEDRVRDRYYFMTRGIGLLAEGERQNRNNPDLRWNIANYYQEKIGRHDEKDKLLCLFEMSLIDPLERDPNRFFRYDWNEQVKNQARLNGVPARLVRVLDEGDWRSDKSFNREDQFRQEVHRLLTTDKAKEAGITEKEIERYTSKIEEMARTLKLSKFVAFAKRHPQLVRRLRERCTEHHSKDTLHTSPLSIVRYLDENRGIPSLFSSDPADVEGFVPESDEDEEPHGHTKMLAVDNFDRFPPLPLPPEKRSIPDPQEYYPDELNSDNEELLVKGGDLLDPFAAARTWFAYAQEPLPKTDPRRPGWAEPVTNPLAQRMPKHMRSILFRNCPPRAQTFIAERLQREGWFDRWDLVEAFDRDAAHPLFTDKSRQDYKVGRTGILKQNWQLAHEMWSKHGKENLLYVDPEELKDKRAAARRFLERYRSRDLKIEDLSRLERHPEGLPEELRDDFEAYVFVSNFDATATIVNFGHFYYWTMAEQKDDALLARRLFSEADVLTLDRRLRARKYEAGLEIWKDILLRNPDLRADGLIQDPLYEYQLKQLYSFNLIEDGGKAMKRALLAQDLIGLALGAPGAVEQRCLTVSQLEQFDKSDQDWPSATIAGPLDGKDPSGRPIIDEAIKAMCIRRFPDKAALAGHPIPVAPKSPEAAGGRPGGPGGPSGRGPGGRGPGTRPVRPSEPQ